MGGLRLSNLGVRVGKTGWQLLWDEASLVTVGHMCAPGARPLHAEKLEEGRYRCPECGLVGLAFQDARGHWHAVNEEPDGHAIVAGSGRWSDLDVETVRVTRASSQPAAGAEGSLGEGSLGEGSLGEVHITPLSGGEPETVALEPVGEFILGFARRANTLVIASGLP